MFKNPFLIPPNTLALAAKGLQREVDKINRIIDFASGKRPSPPR